MSVKYSYLDYAIKLGKKKPPPLMIEGAGGVEVRYALFLLQIAEWSAVLPALKIEKRICGGYVYE